MSTIPNMPALEADLETLLGAERPIPTSPSGLQDRVFSRLGETLDWGGPPSGGGGSAGGIGGVAAILVAVLVAMGGLGYYGLRSASSDKHNTSTSYAQFPARTPQGIEKRPEQSLPLWFGEATRPSRAIAGHVVFQGNPVAGARVVLQSDMTRAGVVEQAETQSAADGSFSFGERHAAWYDVSASASGWGYGRVHLATHDPTVVPNDLVIRLSGCEHVLHGEVRDASGGVIVGAEVLPARGQWPLAVGVTTDSQGRYELCTQAGSLDAIVSAQGYGSLHIKENVVGRRHFDVELVPEAVVVGRVVQAEGGAPVPGMGIWLFPAAWPERIRTTSAVAVSDSEGRFRIAGLSPGRHLVYGKSSNLSARATPVLVDAGQESREVVLRADVHAMLRGQVVDSRGPVPGASIAAVVDGRRRDYQIADAKGEFTLWPLPEGAIHFEVEGYRVVSPAEFEVEGLASDRLVVSVAKQGEIHGTVVLGGQPVHDAEVIASGIDHEVPVASRTDAAGRFSLPGLPAGRYEVSASSAAGRAFSTKKSSLVLDLGEGTVLADLVIELDGTASVSGTVVDQGDRALVQVVVQYANPANGDTCSATTDDAGAFLCGPLIGSGTYVPTVKPDASSSIVFAAAPGFPLGDLVLVDGREQKTGQVLTIQASRALIRGRVVSTGGGPHPDATVRAIESSTGYTPATAPWVGQRTSISGADGSFQISVWEGAEFILHARTPTGAEGSVRKVASGSSRVVIKVKETGDIQGTLLGFDAPPDLLVRRLGNTVDIVRASTTSTSFTVEGLAPGEYAAMAVSGTQGAAKTVVVHSGKTSLVTLDAGKAVQVAIQVVDFATGEPVAGVRCRAAPFIHNAGIFGWGSPLSKGTDAHGRVSMEAPSGSIEIGCQRRRLHHSEGAARIFVDPDRDNQLLLHVVVSETPYESSNSVGVRFQMGFGEVAGFTHTIVQLRPGGVAERAGLQVGDLVLKIDGREIAPLTDSALERLIGTHAIGAAVTLTVLRGDLLLKRAVTVEAPWR